MAEIEEACSNNGSISCPIVNGTYCAGASGTTNIIIRCTNGVGQAGNCNDNLDGEPPLGVSFAPCFDCGDTSGRAACSKMGVVYPGSGTGLGSTPFPTNDTSICSATTGGVPYTNGTNPGGPIINGTNPGGPIINGTNPGGPIINATVPCLGGASPTGGYGSGGSPSSSMPAGYTGAASSVQMLGASAVVGFGAVLAALGMM
ncbi:hypothetical protein LTR36_007388 [Oleoguttula mirabilis]|uniref:Uncharacterized protein n=1 Tax=Oleoguttula mirabilis TaxID=1507867 RepID=A0AAV9JA91_9PEZI|nr:hypothetical protein LTR36_007388 [Oleoguttula mirabilis]